MFRVFSLFIIVGILRVENNVSESGGRGRVSGISRDRMAVFEAFGSFLLG